MKKWILTSLLVLTSIGLRAEDAPEAKEGPCRKMMDACKQSMKRSLFKDCMTPLLAGETVKDVKIDPAIISACKTIKEAHKK